MIKIRAIILVLSCIIICVPTNAQSFNSLKNKALLVSGEFDSQDYESVALNVVDYLLTRTTSSNPLNYNFFNEDGSLSGTLHEYIPCKKGAYVQMSEDYPDLFGNHKKELEIKAAQDDLEAIVFFYGAVSFLNLAMKQYKELQSPILHFQNNVMYQRDHVLMAYIYMAYIFADLCSAYCASELFYEESAMYTHREVNHTRTLYLFEKTTACFKIKKETENILKKVLSLEKPFLDYKMASISHYKKGMYGGPAKCFYNNLLKRKKKYLRKHKISDLTKAEISKFVLSIIDAQ